jgi:hypothetical protein
MNPDKSGTNIFLKIFSNFLGAKKEGGVGGILERGGVLCYTKRQLLLTGERAAVSFGV